MGEHAPAEYIKARIEKTQKRLEDLGVDGLVAFDPAHKGYLSGFTIGTNIAPGGAVFIGRQDLPYIYITGGTDREMCQNALGHLGYEVRSFRSALGQSLNTQLDEVIKDLGVKRLAVESDYISVAKLEDLQEKTGPSGASVITVNDVVNPLREVKDDWEIRQIEQANEVNRIAFEQLLEKVRPGVTEWALAAELENQLRRHGHGSSRLAFQSIVVSGPRSSLPHGEVTRRELQAGDLVTIDFGATWNGYCCDVTRTFCVGKADEKQREVYSAVLDAQIEAIERMQAKRRRQDCADHAMELIRQRGFGDYMAHGAGGHGIGLEVHEGPASRGDEPWEVGNVMTMEPGIYIPGWGGVRIEDNVVIAQDGPRNITHIAKDFLEI